MDILPKIFVTLKKNKKNTLCKNLATMSDIAAVGPTINVLNLLGPRNEPFFITKNF